MDRKKAALAFVGVAGAAVIGYLLTRGGGEDSLAGGGSSGGGPGPQMPMVLGGGEPAPVYNYNFPEYPDMSKKDMSMDLFSLIPQQQPYDWGSIADDFFGGSPAPVQNVFSMPSPVALSPENIETTKKAAELRTEKAPGWGVFRQDLAGSKGLVAYNERIEAKKAAAAPKATQAQNLISFLHGLEAN